MKGATAEAALAAQATEMEAAIAEDLADLDLLDDDKLHLRCLYCVPNSMCWPGMVVTAVCGVRALVPLACPDQKCEACLKFLGKPCPKCGRR